MESQAPENPPTHQEPEAHAAPAQAHAPAHPPTNVMAIIGLISVFVLTPVGFILSIIALHQIKKTGEGGKALAVTGIVLSVIFTLISIATFMVIILVAMSGVQQGASSRVTEANVNTVHMQLEYYYDEEGQYPSYSELTNASWRSINMPGLNSAMSENDLLAIARTPGGDRIAYKPVDSSGLSCDNAKYECEAYTLTMIDYNGGQYTKSSLAPSDAPVPSGGLEEL